MEDKGAVGRGITGEGGPRHTIGAGMASCASCGKHPLHKNKKGVRSCRRCGPKPVMVNGRPVLACSLPK